MTAVVLEQFIGEQPRITARLMQPNAAQESLNVRIEDGTLQPIRASVNAVAADSERTTWQSLIKFADEWLGWDNAVDAVIGHVADDRLYYTGDGTPKMRVAGTVYNLALPAPTTQLTTAVSGSGTGPDVARTYLFTWVTDFGEESEPSPASALVDAAQGQTITLSGFPSAPPARNITKQRIYRSQTGQSGTFFYFIGERAASTADFVDNISLDAFLEPLPSQNWNAPPNDLSGLVSLPNGMMAAFKGRDVYFCEPYRPHAWPEAYILTTDVPIVGLGAVGASLVILTEGQPYIAQGTNPATMQMVKIENNFACLSARTIVDMGYAIAFATHDGLCLVSADGSFRIATEALFSRDDWLALDPANMVSAFYRGGYVGVYNFTDGAGAQMRGAIHVLPGSPGYLLRSKLREKALFSDLATGRLYFVDEVTGEIMLFDAPGAERTNMFWRSKEFVYPQPVNFACAMTDLPTGADLTTAAGDASLIADGDIVVDLAADVINGTELNERLINGAEIGLAGTPSANFAAIVYGDGMPVMGVTRYGRMVRLPGNRSCRRWHVELTGNLPIERFAMATTVDELKMLP